MSSEKYTEYVHSMIGNYKADLALAMNELGKKESDYSFRFFYLPLSDRAHITWALDYLDRQGHTTSSLKSELEAVDRQLEAFKKSHSEEYYDLVRKDFSALIRQFDPLGNYLDQYDLDQQVEKRTDIEILFEELSAYYDMNDRYFEQFFEIRDLYTEKVKDMDEQFRKELDNAFKNEGCSPDDLEIAPDHYWWLHLEEAFQSGEAEYEDKDPDEVIEQGEKVLEKIADCDYKRELEKMIQAAKEAKKQGKKVRVYRR